MLAAKNNYLPQESPAANHEINRQASDYPDVSIGCAQGKFDLMNSLRMISVKNLISLPPPLLILREILRYCIQERNPVARSLAKCCI